MEDTNRPEMVICAAIWYQDQPTLTFLPKNISFGMVVAGYRHPHCIEVVHQLSGMRSCSFGPDATGKSVQGFLTDKNRFVDRKEAAKIAIASGQIKECQYTEGTLYSEDLY